MFCKTKSKELKDSSPKEELMRGPQNLTGWEFRLVHAPHTYGDNKVHHMTTIALYSPMTFERWKEGYLLKMHSYSDDPQDITMRHVFDEHGPWENTSPFRLLDIVDYRLNKLTINDSGYDSARSSNLGMDGSEELNRGWRWHKSLRVNNLVEGYEGLYRELQSILDLSFDVPKNNVEGWNVQLFSSENAEPFKKRFDYSHYLSIGEKRDIPHVTGADFAITFDKTSHHYYQGFTSHEVVQRFETTAQVNWSRSRGSLKPLVTLENGSALYGVHPHLLSGGIEKFKERVKRYFDPPQRHGSYM